MSPEDTMRLLFALRSRGITDRRVLGAMEGIDRAAFVPETFAAQAYDDVALPIARGQTISQPSVVAAMCQALQVGERDRVLEVGTGSGYHAAVLARLARRGRVYTLERHRPLAEAARALHARLGLTNVIVITGDGSLGLPQLAPFDRILVTAAAEDAPGPLLAQLRPGGTMVLPVGPTDGAQQLIRVTRTPRGHDYEELMPVRFVPLVEGMEPD
jgi:protein-L-isoaspartate(D-aspartate) O-methyltransferase